jgi:MFS family permease
MALVVAYWWYERSVPRKYQPPLGRNAWAAEGWAARKYGLKTLYQLSVLLVARFRAVMLTHPNSPMFFWVVCSTQIFQNATVSVYSSNLADIQTVTRGTSTLAAGYNTSLQSVIPIVLTPVVGAFFDRYGWRMVFGTSSVLLSLKGISDGGQFRQLRYCTLSSLLCWAFRPSTRWRRFSYRRSR